MKHLTKPEMAEMSKIMVEGNLALKSCADDLGLTYKKFRKLLFSNKLPELTPEQKQKLDSALPLIEKVREKCVDKIQEAFYYYVVKQARRFSRHDADDLVSEGMLAVWDATFSYSDLSTNFLTYVINVCKRRMIQALRQEKLQKYNEKLEALKIEFDQIKSEYAESVTDYAIMDEMNLTPKKKKQLTDYMRKVFQISQLEDEEHNLDSLKIKMSNNLEEIEVRQAVKNANLSPFELKVFFTFLYPHAGWITKMASEYVGRNKVGCSKQNIHLMKDRIVAQVKNAYLNPPAKAIENPEVDKWFDELKDRKAS